MMAKVYVSSTYLDLIECRRQVSLTLRKLEHEDVAMEYYAAESKRPVEKCLADVGACDLYIGVFAWRYGWIPKENNRKKLSITEMEYRLARELGKCCLIFLLSDRVSWPTEFVDKNRARIEKLREELSEQHTVGFFTSRDSLDSQVSTAVSRWGNKRRSTPKRTHAPRFNRTIYCDILAKRHKHLCLDALTPPDKDEYLQLQLRSIFVEQSVRKDPPPVDLPRSGLINST